MTNKSKIAAIAAASLGMVLTQGSSLLAENNAPEKVTKIAAPIDVDQEVLYSAVSDEALERAAEVGAFGACSTGTCSYTLAAQACNQGQTSLKKPPYVGLKYEGRKVPPKGSTGLTVAPKTPQGSKNK